MKVQITELEAGPGPNEAVVQIDTRDGREEVIVDKEQISSKALEIGSVLGEQDDNALVELPRETLSGKWRVWVSREQLAG